MSDVRRELGEAPRKDKHKPPRLKPDVAEWGRKFASSAKVAYDEDEMYGLDEGEADAHAEIDADGQQADAELEEFHQLSGECDEIEAQLTALVGTEAAPKLPDGVIEQERAEIARLANAVRIDLSVTAPDRARKKLPELQAYLRDADEARAKRAGMRQEVETVTEQFEAQKDLTPEDLEA